MKIATSEWEDSPNKKKSNMRIININKLKWVGTAYYLRHYE